MIHARKDYDRIQDPAVEQPELLADGSSPIGSDEPVFLIRGKDVLAPDCIRHWAIELERLDGHDPAVVQHALKFADLVQNWQDEHGCKTPDVAHEELIDLYGA